MRQRLTARNIDEFIRDRTWGKHCDGGNLYLQGSREYGTWSWLFRFVSPETGAERWMGLGSRKTFSLKEARELAREHRQTVAVGKDPILERQRVKKARRDTAAKTITFKQAAEEFMAQRLALLRNDKHKDQWRTTVRALCMEIGNFPALDISGADINAALASRARTAPETARCTAQRASAIVAWVKDGKPPLVKVQVKHLPAMQVEHLPGFMVDLRRHGGVSALALEFTVLTAARTNEALGAKWDEIEGDFWIVPAGRTKGERTHTVPLSKPAQTVLAKLPRIKGNPYIFPGVKDKQPINHRAMLELLGEMHKQRAREGRPPWVDRETGKPAVVHGFRSAFRDWLGDETEFDENLGEHALAHKVGSRVTVSYRRKTAVKKRVKLMEDWATYCGSPVVDLVEDAA